MHRSAYRARLGQGKEPDDICLQHLPQLGHRLLEQRSVPRDGGVVDEHVDPACMRKVTLMSIDSTER